MAFPCNDFEGQEPGEIDEILEFAKEKYDTNFEIFDKVKRNSPGTSPSLSRTGQISCSLLKNDKNVIICYRILN